VTETEKDTEKDTEIDAGKPPFEKEGFPAPFPGKRYYDSLVELAKETVFFCFSIWCKYS
jgi:hypothetical protein